MPQPQSLYRRLLGDAYGRLPEAIRSMHDIGQRLEAHGEADISRGANRIAGWIASLLRFPREGRGVPVQLVFERDGEREIWRRNFAGHRMVTIQELGEGSAGGLLVERFGPVAFLIRVPSDNAGLRLEPVAGRILGCPLPAWLLPSVNASEKSVGGRFVFDVDITLPIVGRLIRYRGTLVPVRRDLPPQPSPTVSVDDDGPVMLFDGSCNLCCGGVRFFMARDPHAGIRFCAMQSAAGQALLRKHGLPLDHYDSFVVLDQGLLLVRSAAFFHLVRRLEFPWPLIRAGLLVPRPVRDWLYHLIARNRYRISGRRPVCLATLPGHASRFI